MRGVGEGGGSCTAASKQQQQAAAASSSSKQQQHAQHASTTNKQQQHRLFSKVAGRRGVLLWFYETAFLLWAGPELVKEWLLAGAVDMLRSSDSTKNKVLLKSCFKLEFCSAL
jgi:hypothetical protein